MATPLLTTPRHILTFRHRTGLGSASVSAVGGTASGLGGGLGDGLGGAHGSADAGAAQALAAPLPHHDPLPPTSDADGIDMLNAMYERQVLYAYIYVDVCIYIYERVASFCSRVASFCSPIPPCVIHAPPLHRPSASTPCIQPHVFTPPIHPCSPAIHPDFVCVTPHFFSPRGVTSVSEPPMSSHRPIASAPMS